MQQKTPSDTASLALDLVGIEGPGEGLRVRLDPDKPLLVGRGLRGLEVPDPHVSLQHARIEWLADTWMVVDLDSATGTRVDGEVIPPNKPVPIGPDSTIVVGDTTFQVLEPHAIWRRVAEVAAVVALVLSLLVAAIWFLAPRGTGGVALVWFEEINQGPERATELALDRPFLRRRGLDPRQLRIRRVTDADQDGIDEVWLQTPAGTEQVITFDMTGRWVELGEIPQGCLDIRDQGGTGLPMLDCGALTYAILDTGRYQPLAQDGVVFWGVPKEDWKGPGMAPSSLVKGYRGSLRRKVALAGFLAANGVDEGIHYLICENTFDKVLASVLLRSGEIRPLAIGCGQAISVTGVDLYDVRAVAFTAGGHAALLDDIEVFLSGGADGIFRDPKLDDLSEAWHRPVEGIGARYVSFDGQDHYFEPVAPEAPIPGVRELPHDLPRVPPLSQTTVVVGTGIVQLDPPGCAVFEVQTEPWTCPMAQGCLPSSPFLRLRNIGCGEEKSIEATYAGGTFDAEIGNLEVRVRIDSTEYDNDLDVHQARVAWREIARY